MNIISDDDRLAINTASIDHVFINGAGILCITTKSGDNFRMIHDCDTEGYGQFSVENRSRKAFENMLNPDNYGKNLYLSDWKKELAEEKRQAFNRQMEIEAFKKQTAKVMNMIDQLSEDRKQFDLIEKQIIKAVRNSEEIPNQFELAERLDSRPQWIVDDIKRLESKVENRLRLTRAENIYKSMSQKDLDDNFDPRVQKCLEMYFIQKNTDAGKIAKEIRSTSQWVKARIN